MAIDSSILAWRIPWTEEPGRLQSMGLQRVRHDYATNFHFTFMCLEGFCGSSDDKQTVCNVPGFHSRVEKMPWIRK